MRQKMFAMVVMAAVVLATGAGYAQTPAAAPAAQQKPEPVIVPLKVTVVITRQKSDKAQTVVSRLPFELWVNTGRDGASLRFHSEVAVPTSSFSTEKNQVVQSYSNKTLQTSVTCNASDLGNGRFRLDIGIDDAQLLPMSRPAEGTTDFPQTATQYFRATTQPVLRDGQTIQHSLATDKISGDVVKVEITLNVVK
jgi:archaellin